jgi:glycosyltransferase involved in cell wall biosynthesis
MGEYGRRRVEACFTTDRLAREIADVYRQVAS